jgi:hypothetical protein
MNQVQFVPLNADSVTADWLTDALRIHGILSKSRVTNLHFEPVASQGIIGQVFLFYLSYDAAELGQPQSLILKFPSPDPQARKDLQFMHQREILFYQNFSADSAIPMPKYYYSVMDENSADNLLLLEDLSGNARPGCLTCGCSLEEAELAVIQLAKFHAAWWESDQLDQFAWINHKREFSSSYSKDQFFAEWDDLLQKIRSEMPDFELSGIFIETASQLARNFKRVKNFLYNAPVTLIHDDYHLDNMIFRDGDTGPEAVIIDWQCVAKGPGVCDLGYFLAFCLSSEQRSQIENNLLKTYYQVLCEQGVRGYDYSRFLLDYRLSVLEPLERLVQVRGALNRSYPRGLAIFQATLGRLKASLENSRIAELIG